MSLSTKGIRKITPEIATKLDMRPGGWFRNLLLWDCYKARPQAFDRCVDHEEVIAKGLLPEELILSDCIDMDSF
jgi:hypothetical protein